MDENETMKPKSASMLARLRGVSFKPSSSYIYLLFSTGATRYDYFLIITGLIAAVGAGIPFPLLGILFGQLVNELDAQSCSISASSTSGDLSSSVNSKVLNIIYVTIANFVLIYVHSGCWSMVGERLVRRLRTRYLSSLLRQNLAFFDTLPAGEVSHRLDADLQSIQTGTSEKVGLCISSVSYFVAAFVVAFLQSPKLAAILISIVPCFFLMAWIGSHYGGKYSRRVSESVAKATAVASGGLSNMVVVKAFGAGRKLETVFAKHVEQARIDGFKKSVVSSVQMGLLYFIAYCANALAFWEGSRLIADSVAEGDGGQTTGAIYTVIFVLVDASFIISQVAPFLQLFASATAAYSHLQPIIERLSEIDGTTSSDGIVLSSVAGNIEFKEVTFAYSSRPDTDVLKSFSLQIPARKHTAFVGLSGSGKSTIASLVNRLYDPKSGEVTLDGVNLRDLNTRSLRKFIGFVEQNGDLFDRSILENIAHGLINGPGTGHEDLQESLLDSSLPDLAQRIMEGSTIEDALENSSESVRKIWKLVNDASEMANASLFISKLSHDLATSVGSCGSQLSGGQKQRIVLARAIVRQPDILVLDEATASLDSTSEEMISKALDIFSKGRTTITIAHRLSTIKNADRIVVMKDGSIVEQGSYQELLDAGGALANMIKLQNVSANDDSDSVFISPKRPNLQKRNSKVSSFRSEKSYKTFIEGEVAGSKDPVPYGFVNETKFMDMQGGVDESVIDDDSGDGDETAKKDKQRKKKKSNFKNLLSVFGMSRPWLGLVLLGLAGAAIVGGSHTGEAVIFGETIGGLSPCRGVDGIHRTGNLFGLLFFILAIVVFAANVVSTSSFGSVAESMLYKIKILLLRSLFHQEIEWHESEGRTPSSLLSYISNDANQMSGLTGTVFGVIFSILLNMISGIILAHIIAWKIAIVLLATVPILLASGFMRLRVLAQFHERHQKAFANSVGIATEAISSIKTIATFSLEEETLKVYKRSLEGPYKATVKSIAVGNIWLAAAFSISNLVYALAYYWGSRQIANGTYTQTQFFIVLPALLFSAQSCGQMFSLAPDVSKASVAAGRVLGLIRAGPQDQSVSLKDTKIMDVESCSSSGTGIDEMILKSDSSLGLQVTFNGVHFAYPSRSTIPVLKGLSLAIQPNTFCAVVGKSGAGKSTIVSILERFYSPARGFVALDGRDLRSLPGDSFRDDIALVPQSSSLFQGTVAFNIRIGARSTNPNPPLSDLIEACKAANIHETIMALPQGYETECGPNGGQFSGGQLQRLAIARALVRKPRLLLLDESTSALDAESEALMQDSLQKAKMSGGLTVIAVAHRLRTIKGADKIFLIDDGSCIDEGTHAELLDRSESYRKNVALQTLE